MRPLVLALGLVACSGDEATEPTFHPTLTFLSPEEGGTVAAGDVTVSVVVEDFELTAPETAARAVSPAGWWWVSAALAHDEEGIPSGYVALSLDGGAELVQDEAIGTLAGVAAGAHTLDAALRFADGDELEPPVEVSVSFTAE